MRVTTERGQMLRGENARDCGRGDEAVGLEGGRTAEAAQGVSQKGPDRAPIATGDDDDIEMDRGSIEDGDVDARNQSALSFEEIDLYQYSGLTRLMIV